MFGPGQRNNNRCPIKGFELASLPSPDKAAETDITAMLAAHAITAGSTNPSVAPLGLLETWVTMPGQYGSFREFDISTHLAQGLWPGNTSGPMLALTPADSNIKYGVEWACTRSRSDFWGQLEKISKFGSANPRGRVTLQFTSVSISRVARITGSPILDQLGPSPMYVCGITLYRR
jgi:hypothetical protein